MPAWLVFTLFTLLVSACAGPGNNENPTPDGLLIVASKSGDDVYFIDRWDGSVVYILPAGREPHEVEVSDDGALAVVCNYGDREQIGNTLSVYDVASGKLVSTIDLGEHTRPHGMQWITGTQQMLVTTEGSQHLVIVDIEAGQVVKAMDTGEPVSHMVAATPDFSKAFVPSIRTGNVVVFDLNTGDLIGSVYSGAGAEGIAMHPSGVEVWVTNRSDNTIAIIDTESLTVTETIPCADFPIRAKFTPNGKLFLVSNARSGDIGVFDHATRQQLAAIKLTPPVPEGVDETRYFSEFEGTSIPIGLVVPDNHWAYVANTRSDAVSIISLDTFTITVHFPVGREPDGISFSPVTPKAGKQPG